VVAVVVGVGLLAGCGSDDEDPVATGDPPGAEPTGPGAGAGEELSGLEFLSESTTEGGQPVELVTGTRIRLTFHDDGRLTVHAGCNTLDATPTISADRIDVGDGLSTTDMGCDPTLHDQDGWLADLLTAGPTYVLDGDRLTLTAGDRVVELLDREVADPDRPLEGTTWTLDGLIDGDVASSVPGDVAATVTFADGAVTVEGTGCNGGGGSYTLDEAAHEVTVPALAWTRMACEGPSASVEAALGAVLDGTVGYEIEAAHLTLTHPGGKGLTLRAG
jgi:heat shock protein HslJ